MSRQVLVLGRERHLVDASVAVIRAGGFATIGVTRDEEALALIDTGRFIAVLIGSAVEAASRGPVRSRASPHGTAVLEARRTPTQSVPDHVRQVVLPELLKLRAPGRAT